MSNENNEEAMSSEEIERLARERVKNVVENYERKRKLRFATELAEIMPKLSAENILELLANDKKIVAQDSQQLEKIIDVAIRNFGNHCNLNFIDVSNVTDMIDLFYNSQFNGDISQWDVSKVKDMSGMFYGSSFNGDVSNWDVSNVINMHGMFKNSHFSRDISSWRVLISADVEEMFDSCPLEKKQLHPENKVYSSFGR